MPDPFKQIGEIIASARKEQKKDLKDISESTKLMVRYLEAIEAGDPSQLPSATYFRLFARSYAQNLGIDPAVIDEIADRDPSGLNKTPSPAEAAEKKEKKEKKKEAEEESEETTAKGSSKGLLIIAVIILGIIAVVLIYQFFLVDKTATSGPEEAAKPLGAEVGEVPDMDNAGIEATPYTPSEPLKLNMLANQDVWALVVRDGDTVLNRELKGGERRSWEAKYRYYITLGISTAVDLSLNGEKIAPLTERPRTVQNVEINQTNYEKFLLKNNPQSAVLPPVQPRRPAASEQPASTTSPASDTTSRPAGETGNGN
ncbi:MAG: helix-turn-helix domain-containing protein [Candidatus Zixiibacteriota bacterium]